LTKKAISTSALKGARLYARPFERVVIRQLITCGFPW
jgi:hypothetical protein